MIKPPRFWGIHAEPELWLKWALAALPFVILLALYFNASQKRLAVNPDDKILPSFAQMTESAYRVAFVPDKRKGEYVLFTDTASSLKRLATGVLLAAVAGLLLGINMGVFPGFRDFHLPVITFVSIIPPLSLLPILFITFGVDELAKVMLIFIGVFPAITRDVYQTVSQIPREQITKALTLGASQLQVTYLIVLPQIMPKLLDAVRLCLGPAWLFLIAAEAIASTDGLGYRIFLVRRYLAMDVIIPYALWITFIGFSADWLLRKFVAWKYPWYVATK